MLVAAAPKLMKLLTVVGTAAMFLVGGGIIVHGIPLLAQWLHDIEHLMVGLGGAGRVLAAIAPLLYNAVVGLVVGGVAVLVSLPFVKSSAGKH